MSGLALHADQHYLIVGSPCAAFFWVASAELRNSGIRQGAYPKGLSEVFENSGLLPKLWSGEVSGTVVGPKN